MKAKPFQIFIPSIGVSYSEDQDPIWIVIAHLDSDPDPVGANIILASGPTKELVIKYLPESIGQLVQVLGCVALRELFSDLAATGMSEVLIDSNGPKH